MGGLDCYGRMDPEKLEKSLTNLNIHMAALVAKREDAGRSLKEFLAKFWKQQEVMDEETKQVRIEMMKLRKATQRGV